MNKSEMIEWMSGEADISKAAAGRALDAFMGAVRTQLRKGDTILLAGFGTFSLSKRLARKGRNPRTGEEIKIKAAKAVKFRVGKGLKDAVNV
jgi:DNA-binding protein HU-beta